MGWPQADVFRAHNAGGSRESPKGRKMASYLSLYTKPKSEWVKDLNIQTETCNLLENKRGETLEDINTGKTARIDKWVYIRLKHFRAAKESVSRVKRRPTKLRENFASYSTERELEYINRSQKNQNS